MANINSIVDFDPEKTSPETWDVLYKNPRVMAYITIPETFANGTYGTRIHRDVMKTTAGKLNKFLELLRLHNKCPNVYRPAAGRDGNVLYQLLATYPTGIHDRYSPYPEQAATSNGGYLYFTTPESGILRFYIFLWFLKTWGIPYNLPIRSDIDLKGSMTLQKPNGDDNLYYYTITNVEFTGITPDNIVYPTP